ncbi:MAG: ribonuclease III [Leptospiraceae bacterium]|nr:ribonuclease III [Leptospiraceae bacterium]
MNHADWLLQIHEFAARFQITSTAMESLAAAFTHSSRRNEDAQVREDNQRLEFLGDAVLGLIINEYLYNKYPDYAEGQLSAMKDALVAEEPLAHQARKAGMGTLLRMGRGERLGGGADRSSNLADALEAVIGAVFLTASLAGARQFVLQIFADVLESRPGQARFELDPKTTLQELFMKRHHCLPEYRVIKVTGPEHRPEFEVAVYRQKMELARGKGSSIKKAEIEAARKALAE